MFEIPKQDPEKERVGLEEVNQGKENSPEKQKETIDEAFRSFREILGDVVVEARQDVDKLSPEDIEIYGDKKAFQAMKETLGWPDFIVDSDKTKKLKDMYEEYDPTLFELRQKMLGSQVRHTLSHVYSHISDMDFLSSPSSIKNKDVAHYPWFDVVGLSRFLQLMQKDEYKGYSEDQKDTFGSLKNKLDQQLSDLVSSVDQVDHKALVFGITKGIFDEKIQTTIWERLKKDPERLSINLLEELTCYGNRKDIALEAWELLRGFSPVALEVYSRLESQAAISQIQKEAAQILLSEIEDEEYKAKRGDKEAIQKLKYFGYGQEPASMYVDSKNKVIEKANS